MMSQALEDRLPPPPESKLEYTPWNPYQSEDLLGDGNGMAEREGEDEIVDLNFL
jgi:hypothetical protein